MVFRMYFYSDEMAHLGKRARCVVVKGDSTNLLVRGNDIPRDGPAGASKKA